MTEELSEKEILELVRLSQKGEKEAFAKLYDVYLTPIYRYVFFRADKSEVEDITEMVFVKAFEKIRTYKKGKTKFSSWLFRIAHNQVIDFYRGKRESLEMPEQYADDKEESDPRKRMEKVLTRHHLGRALGRLKDNHRQVLILKYINDLNNQEIAQVIGKREGAIRVMQTRALSALRAVLEAENIDF